MQVSEESVRNELAAYLIQHLQTIVSDEIKNESDGLGTVLERLIALSPGFKDDEIFEFVYPHVFNVCKAKFLQQKKLLKEMEDKNKPAVVEATVPVASIQPIFRDKFGQFRNGHAPNCPAEKRTKLV
jgi:hypothetical protein